MQAARRRRGGRISPIASIKTLPLVLLIVSTYVVFAQAHRDGGAIGSIWATDPGRPELGSLALDASPRPLALDTRDANTDGEPQLGAATRPISQYWHAAEVYRVSPALLEAVHQVESGAAPDGCVANRTGSGAVGPFQFKPATFRQYAVDGNGDGIADVCNFVDALFSAAHYLRSIGADTDLDSPTTYAALTRYGTDPARVIDLARHYARRDGEESAAARRDAVHSSTSRVTVEIDRSER